MTQQMQYPKVIRGIYVYNELEEKVQLAIFEIKDCQSIQSSWNYWTESDKEMYAFSKERHDNAKKGVEKAIEELRVLVNQMPNDTNKQRIIDWYL